VTRTLLAAALLAALAGCRAAAPRVVAPERSPPPPPAHEVEDGSYDWHGLLVAPFGSVLKDIPLALHEVLLFREHAHGGGTVEDAAGGAAECFATDSPAPQFLGRTPDEFLLCLRQDRLSRIQAAVRLPAAEASVVFAAACAAWMRNAAPPAAHADASGAAAPACEGRDGAIQFRGRLEEDEPILSITLDDVSAP
jgi:hypothetical protein